VTTALLLSKSVFLENNSKLRIYIYIHILFLIILSKYLSCSYVVSVKSVFGRFRLKLSTGTDSGKLRLEKIALAEFETFY